MQYERTSLDRRQERDKTLRLERRVLIQRRKLTLIKLNYATTLLGFKLSLLGIVASWVWFAYYVTSN